MQSGFMKVKIETSHCEEIWKFRETKGQITLLKSKFNCTKGMYPGRSKSIFHLTKIILEEITSLLLRFRARFHRY